ncbi:MAG TPA: type I polyketide synthase, partial [Thermoanaerobaculia bacterium]
MRPTERPASGDVARAGPAPPLATPRALPPLPAAAAVGAPAELGAVAVIGLACRFPGASTPERFWQNLAAGVESISTFSTAELAASGIGPELSGQPGYVRARATLEGAELFDAHFFGISPREAAHTDPQQRLFLECAWEALENAGCDPTRSAGPVGVFAGVGPSTYLLSHLLSNPEFAAAADALELRLGNDRDFLATLVSYRLNLQGPSVAVSTACSTSLVAVHLACQSLLDRECQIALAGGAAVSFPQKRGYLYRPGGIVSADGHCRAFDARASGTVSGEGVGVVVLKPLADALAAGDFIHAVIRGSAINNDGARKIGFTAPSVEGQAAVIAEAHALAGVDPATITYVEAHGSATRLGDPVEVRALTRAFRAGTDQQRFCALGSVKTNLGHLDAAAGIASLIKTVLCLERRQIPPTLHYREANPQLELAGSPFYVNAELRDWPLDGTPRRAGVSSFGMGGTNAHLVLEEAPELRPGTSSRRWQLIVLSAATPAALEAATDRLAAHLRSHPEQELADVAYTMQAGRKAHRCRRFLLAASAGDAASALAARDAQRLQTNLEALPDRPVAFMLSGVGDHYPGMATGLYRDEPVFRRHFDSSAELLAPLLGADLREILFTDPGEPAPGAPGGTDLRRMLGRAAPLRGKSGEPPEAASIVQPAVFALELALAALWQSWGVQPTALIGYSLGEYAAACLAGVFPLADGLRLVARRARLLEQLPTGAMVAVALPEAQARELLSAGLALAAASAPELCVIAGPDAAV